MTDTDLAERLTRRRALVLTVFGSLMIVGGIAGMADGVEPGAATFRVGAWAIQAAAMLVLLATGGGFLRSRKVRSLMNDETTRDHRQRAIGVGFWAAVLAAFGLYSLSLFHPVTGREAIRLILTCAVSTTLLIFGALERYSLK